MARTSFLARGIDFQRASRVRNTHDKGAIFKTQKTKTNMAARGFFCPRSLLYRWPRNSLIKEASLHRKTCIYSVYLRKTVSGIHCFQCFPNFKERTKDSQSGCKYGEWTYPQKFFGLFFFATFYNLYFVCSTNTGYAADRDDEKPNCVSRRHRGCRTEVNENHPEEEIDLEPPRKTETRSQVRSSSADYLLLLKVSEHLSGPSADGLAGIAVSYDMGWQKRGRGHNSSTSHGAAMGLTTGKVVSYSTRCKTCGVCSHNKVTGKEKQHDCRKNHSGSSKSMERDLACELWSKAPQSGVQFSIYVGDDDSTTLADIKNKVPYGVEKWSDIVHTKRSLNSRLYKLRERFKGPNCSVLSPKVINYLTKCFSYCSNQNVGDSNSLKKGLKNIVPHAFGDHSCCDNACVVTNKILQPLNRQSCHMVKIFLETHLKRL